MSNSLMIILLVAFFGGLAVVTTGRSGFKAPNYVGVSSGFKSEGVRPPSGSQPGGTPRGDGRFGFTAPGSGDTKPHPGPRPVGAPEIDGSTLPLMATLLVGGILVLTERRRK